MTCRGSAEIYVPSVIPAVFYLDKIMSKRLNGGGSAVFLKVVVTLPENCAVKPFVTLLHGFKWW